MAIFLKFWYWFDFKNCDQCRNNRWQKLVEFLKWSKAWKVSHNSQSKADMNKNLITDFYLKSLQRHEVFGIFAKTRFNCSSHNCICCKLKIMDNLQITEWKIRCGGHLWWALHILQYWPVEVLHNDTCPVGQRKKCTRSESDRDWTNAWRRQDFGHFQWQSDSVVRLAGLVVVLQIQRIRQ